MKHHTAKYYSIQSKKKLHEKISVGGRCHVSLIVAAGEPRHAPQRAPRETTKTTPPTSSSDLFDF